MTPLAEAQTVVQQQLAEHGACSPLELSPLELLLATNQLDYDDYQAWRRGERATLDDALVEGIGSARQLIGEARFPAAALKYAWDAASDADIEPPVTAPWFPAWVVLEVPGTARVVAPSDFKSDPARAFNALVALAAGGNDRQEMDNRRTLQALHPGLLSRYLGALDA